MAFRPRQILFCWIFSWLASGWKLSDSKMLGPLVDDAAMSIAQVQFFCEVCAELLYEDRGGGSEVFYQLLNPLNFAGPVLVFAILVSALTSDDRPIQTT